MNHSTYLHPPQHHQHHPVCHYHGHLQNHSRRGFWIEGGILSYRFGCLLIPPTRFSLGKRLERIGWFAKWWWFLLINWFLLSSFFPFWYKWVEPQVKIWAFPSLLPDNCNLLSWKPLQCPLQIPQNMHFWRNSPSAWWSFLVIPPLYSTIFYHIINNALIIHPDNFIVTTTL